MDLQPLAQEVAVACDPRHAFAVYAERTDEWWPRLFSAEPDALEGFTMEPYVGGRLTMRYVGGNTQDVGEVLVWEPGERLVHTWTLAQPADRPSQVTVSFEPRVGGCAVRLEHEGWHEANATNRSQAGDWPAILWAFAGLAEREDERVVGPAEVALAAVAGLVAALRGRRSDDAVACFTDDAALFGSEEGEQAFGAVALRDFFGDLVGRSYTVGWDVRDPAARRDGDLVWFVAPGELVVRHDDGREERLGYRVSGVLRETPSGWRFELFNGAQPGPPPGSAP
jgi:ketosteroid isomerase-like protein/uncharacterized protein YndB with AHSA1/START domain